jgi:type II restriction/modification system DNA methylase subunit YeeA
LPRFARNDERDLFATAPTQPVTTGIETTIAHLINTFAHAKTFGSLIQIAPQHLPGIRNLLPLLNEAQHAGDLYAQSAANDLLPLVQQALVLGMQFDAVVANPPYMGAKAFTIGLKEWLRIEYPGNDKDLFSAFIARMQTLAKSSGFARVMTSFVWMFIATFEQLRKTILTEQTINSLIQLNYDAFADAKAHVCTFVLQNARIAGHKSAFIRLADFPGVENQGPKTLEAIGHRKCDWFYEAAQDEFLRIPGSPIAYWIKNAKPFDGSKIGDKFISGGRTKTHGNEHYLRFWWEIEKSNEKWALYVTGGDFRKYAGNLLQVINWSNEARTFYDSHGGLYPEKFWFKEGITWGKITSARVSFRIKPNVAHYDSGAGAIFSNSFTCDKVLLGFLNSPIVDVYLKAMNPTVNTTVNDAFGLPFPKLSDLLPVEASVNRLINCYKTDWDAYEYSSNFESIPICRSPQEAIPTLESSYISWVIQNQKNINKMGFLEEENNQRFIDSFEMNDDVNSAVPLEQITLTVNPRYRYGGNLTEQEQWDRFQKNSMEELISYAIGRVMGRYSLDEPSLIYAHAGNIGFDPSRYATFPADADGIVPITDTLWFNDDAASRVRKFLLVVWGQDTLEENMAWLAESIGSKAGETPDESIRRYLSDRFYKDHLQTYKKRPIYWQFSSGKQGAFQALVYLHRYTEGTLARLRAEYVVPLTGKMQARLDSLEKDAQAASSTAARNKINKEIEKLKKKHLELLAYDEKLRHHADMRITLDLDDGVKVNYGKFGDLLADVKTVTGGAGDE